MSNQHNLDEDASESFEFILGGHTYQMRYPTTEEIEDVDKKDDTKMMEWMYSFISSKEENAPAIKEALAKKNLKVMQKFNQMLEVEFGVDVNGSNTSR